MYTKLKIEEENMSFVVCKWKSTDPNSFLWQASEQILKDDVNEQSYIHLGYLYHDRII